MLIQINSDIMLSILTKAGVETNDAKAIIYDLILASEKKILGFKKLEVKENIEPSEEDNVIEEKIEVAVVQKEELEEKESEPEGKETKLRRSAKRVSFSAFGGPALGLK